MDQHMNPIDAFKAADEDQRLSMFLTYRDCRSQFMDIYMSERSHSGATAVQRVSGTKGHGHWRNCWAWLKCCRPASLFGSR